MFSKWKIPKGRMSVVMLFLMIFFCSLSHASDGPKDITVHASQVNEKAEGTVGTRTLLVRGDYNYPPYEYLDDHGKPQGFNVDIINAVTDAMGLKVEIDLGPWEEVRLQGEEGKVDALIGMFNSAERDKLFDFSIPHFIASYAVFVRDGSPIQSLDDARNSKIIVQLSDLGHDYLQENAITQDIIIKKDWSDVLTSLAKGEGDCAIVSRLQGTQLIGNLSIANIKAVGPPIIQRKYSIAVTQDNSTLLAQINEGLSIIKATGKYDQIYKKWFGIYTEQPLTFVKAFKYFFWIVLPLMALAITGFLWSWTLRKRVNLRTNDLNNELLEHRRTENALLRRENQLRKILEILPIGLWLADKDGNLLRGNPMGLQIWGAKPNIPISEYGPIKGCRLPSREPIEPDDWALVKTVREGVTIIDELLEIESFDGKKKTILNYTAPVLDDNGNIDGAIVVNLDISDRMVLENQLLQSQKMEAIGTLAAGIAHEFNNMLAIIMGNNELIMEELSQGSLARESTEEIRIAGLRARDVVKQLLTFSRQDDAVKKVMDFTSVVQESLKLIRSSIPINIKIEQNLSADTYPVMCNDTQINQLLINLCNNAVDALPEKEGRITIELLNETIDIQQTKHQTKLKPGQYAKLMVSDNGIGMDNETLDRVFEPYFTTKKIGEGTGIGMAVVHGIIERHGGAIIADSNPGRGTTFNIFLPAHEGLIEQESEERDILPSGDECILYVDDEPSIATLGKRLLEHLGYTTESMTDPEKALDMVRTDPDKFDLLITDMAMPNMTGDQLVIEVLKIRQDMPTIICTGYSAKISEKEAANIGVRSYIMKPINKSELAKTVRKVLDEVNIADLGKP